MVPVLQRDGKIAGRLLTGPGSATMARVMDIERFKVFLHVPEESLELVRELFSQIPQVEVVTGSVFETTADAVVVPLNSFGFFDSGLALEATDRYGLQLQDELRARIEEKHFGELLVGAAEIMPTGVETPRYIIAAPIARTTPGDLRDTVNVYLAARGALLAVRNTPELGINSVAFPLMGVSEGKLTPYTAARQIRYGIRAVLRRKPRRVQHLSKAARREKALKYKEEAEKK